MNPITDIQKNQLKQESFPFLPRNLETIGSQKQTLDMLAQVVLPVRVCAEKADREIWPQVQAGTMPLNQAVTQCAYDADRLIGMTIIENLKLREQPRNELLKAWIVLDYYIYVLKSEYSVNIRKLQDHISGLLAAPAAPEAHSAEAPQEIPVTTPVDLPPIQSRFEMDPPPVPMDIPQETTAAVQVKKEKTGGKKKVIAIVAALVLILAAAGYYLLELAPISKAEAAIEAIGEVTMDSEPAIEAAEALYAGLKESQQPKVENIQTLLDARNSFDTWEKAIDDAHAAIDAIGTVTLDSSNAIKKARSAYDKLKIYGLESHAASKLPTLTKAEKAFEELTIQSLCDAAAVKMEEKNWQEALDAYNAILEDYPKAANAAQIKTNVMDCTAALAQEQIKNNDLEAAMVLLMGVEDLCDQTESYTKTYTDLTQKLSYRRPANGKIFHNNVDWGYGKLTLEATADKDVLFKVYTKAEPTKYTLVYVRAGNSTQISLKDGTYTVTYTTGDHWYSQDDMFGQDAEYGQSIKTYYYTTTREGRWIYYYARTASMKASSDDYMGSLTMKAEDF